MCKTMKDLEQAVAEYKSMKAMVDEAQKELDKAKAEIIDYMTSHKKAEETGKNFVIHYTPFQRTNFDGDKLKTLLGANLPSYQKVTTSNRLTVS